MWGYRGYFQPCALDTRSTRSPAYPPTAEVLQSGLWISYQSLLATSNRIPMDYGNVDYQYYSYVYYSDVITSFSALHMSLSI